MRVRTISFLLIVFLLLSGLAIPTIACPPPPCDDCYTWNPETEECEWDCGECCECVDGSCDPNDSNCGDPNCWDCVDCNCVTIDVNSVSLDKEFECVGCDVTFTVTTDPSGHEGDVEWSAAGGDPNSGSGSTFTTNWDTSGTKTATASLCGTSDSNQVTVVGVSSLLPDIGTLMDDGDGDPNTKSYVVSIVDANGDPNIVTVTATPNPDVNEEDLPDSWSFIGGTEVNDFVHTVDRTTAAKTVFTCTCGTSSKTATIYVMDANIVQPKGSKDANPNPTDSFLKTGPYRFDFQWVEVDVPGYYSNTIEGEILPSSVISDLNSIDYFWSVSDGEFDPHDSGQPKKKTGTATPTYKATEIDSSITLTLDPNACGTITKLLETFQDHLARDYANFETGGSCEATWYVETFNVDPHVAMGTWNCHGSTRHAYNGTYSDSRTGQPWLSWDVKTLVVTLHDSSGNGSHPALGTLERGDVVAYFSPNGRPYDPPNISDLSSWIMQHSQTCTGSGDETYGANNEPKTYPGTPGGCQSWKWATSPAGDWGIHIWQPSLQGIYVPFIIVVFDKP